MTIKEYLQKLCFFLGLDEGEVEIQQSESKEKIVLTVSAADDLASKLIGPRDQTLRAIKMLLNTTFYEDLQEKKLYFDINDCVKNKEAELINMIEEVAQTVIETGQPQTLYDLNSYERFLVHSQIASNEKFSKLGSYSTSVGFRRYLTICLKEDLPVGSSDNENSETQ